MNSRARADGPDRTLPSDGAELAILSLEDEGGPGLDKRAWIGIIPLS